MKLRKIRKRLRLIRSGDPFWRNVVFLQHYPGIGTIELIDKVPYAKYVGDFTPPTEPYPTDRYAHLAEGNLRQAIRFLPVLSGVRVGTKRSGRKQVSR